MRSVVLLALAVISIAGCAAARVDAEVTNDPVTVTLAVNYQPVYDRVSAQMGRCQAGGFLAWKKNTSTFSSGSTRTGKLNYSRTSLFGDVTSQDIDIRGIDETHTSVTVAVRGGSPEQLSQSVIRWANGETGC